MTSINDIKCRSQAIGKIDISENLWAKNMPSVLETLLLDMTSGNNIIWATTHYNHLGPEYAAEREIILSAITGGNGTVIQPRVEKSSEEQWLRTKGKAEVFTPSWFCNIQNNLVDEAWFNQRNVFNSTTHKGWKTNDCHVKFDVGSNKTWKKYVDDTRLEVSCGEAPYLVSRYDTTTGKPIGLSNRIGILDRKLRIVTENASCEEEWLIWAKRAYQSVYAFELQGDSVLLARENLLASYQEYFRNALQREAKETELLEIARIISWNIWQMDACTSAIPTIAEGNECKSKNGIPFRRQFSPLCLIYDWHSNQTVTFSSILRNRLI